MMKLKINSTIGSTKISITTIYTENGTVLWFPRIIGGKPASLGDFPAKVSLQTADEGFHFCGGSLIKEINVLTAGLSLFSTFLY